MAAGGCKVFSFDPSIDVEAHVRKKPFGWWAMKGAPPSFLNSEEEADLQGYKQQDEYPGEIDFKPIGLGAADKHITGEEMASHETQRWKVRTLQSLMKGANVDRLDVLKIDVEGHEWASLEAALDDGALSRVEQLVFEVRAAHASTGN